MFALESPHPGGSNEYTLYTIFNIKWKITLNYHKSTGDFFKVHKHEFETAMVSEPLKFNCNLVFDCLWYTHYCPINGFDISKDTVNKIIIKYPSENIISHENLYCIFV